MADTAKCWSERFGDRGLSVTVCERKPGGMLYVRYKKDGRYKYKSLEHRDRKKAKRYARDEITKLEKGKSDLLRGVPTLARVFRLYLKHVTPTVGDFQDGHHRRCARAWSRHLGADKDLSAVTRLEWDEYVAWRTSGERDAHYMLVPENKRRQVGWRTVERDTDFLRGVIHWACNWQDPATGQYLMGQHEDPTRGYPDPGVKGKKVLRPVKRPVADSKRFNAVRSVADQVTMLAEWDGPRKRVPSHMPELLDLAWQTGRRISAICNLMVADVTAESGSIVWPAATDKERHERIAPINQTAQAAVTRALNRLTIERTVHGGKPVEPTSPLFPSPKNLDRPVDKRLASRWLEKAERLAEVPKLKQGLWHPFRRAWATNRRDLPEKDVAKAGGWSSPDAMKLCYQHATDEGVLEAVQERE